MRQFFVRGIYLNNIYQQYTAVTVVFSFHPFSLYSGEWMYNATLSSTYNKSSLPISSRPHEILSLIKWNLFQINQHNKTEPQRVFSVLWGTLLLDFDSEEDSRTSLCPKQTSEVLGISEWDGQGRGNSSYPHGLLLVTHTGELTCCSMIIYNWPEISFVLFDIILLLTVLLALLLIVFLFWMFLFFGNLP